VAEEVFECGVIMDAGWESVGTDEEGGADESDSVSVGITG
tara:strand:- start:161 stop:280 length:120 start_codon:yes stop_codon:yes gene_type:complete